MPIASDPDKTTLYWLEVDKDKPLEERPVFVVRYLTQKQINKVYALLDEFDRSNDMGERFKILIDALRVGIVGWRNMPDAETGEPVPFNLDDIQRVLVNREIVELAVGYPWGVRMDTDDEKKSDSPAAAAGEASATSAATASA